MSKLFVVLFFVFGLWSCGQDPDLTNASDTKTYASREPQNRHALLEIYTNVRDGHFKNGIDVVERLKDKYEDQVHVIRIEAGNFVGSTDRFPTDFSNPFGDSLYALVKPPKLPGGTINRANYIDKSFSGFGSIAVPFTFWPEIVSGITSSSAEINLGGQAAYSRTTRQLTVEMEAYFLELNRDTTFLHVALIENNIIAQQNGGGEYYQHNNVLRDFLTGFSGQPIPPHMSMSDTNHLRSFQYRLPEFYGLGPDQRLMTPNIEEFEVIAFVTDHHSKVLNSCSIPITIN